MDIGFIGMGRMGSRMAARLLAAGHTLSVNDLNHDACVALVERGATARATPRDVAQCSAIVLTSVPGPAEVEDVIAGPSGVLSGIRPGALVIEMSTIGPVQSRALARRCAEAGAGYIDAPVNNGPLGAEAGELTIMVGGDEAAYRQALPILRCLATNIYHMGPTGSGNIVKLLNQMIFLSYVASFCEAARLARQSGLNMVHVVDMLRNSVAGNPLMTGWEKHLVPADLTYGFLIRRVLKDLDLGAQVCLEQNFEAPVLDTVIRTFREMGEAGHMETDMTALYVLGR